MDHEIEKALQADTLIDITTIGRNSGQPHKIEITFHYLDSRLYISGGPGTRDWYANMVANPEFTFHLKQSMQKDIPAKATPVLDEPSRRELLAKVTARWKKEHEIEKFVKDSPLVEIQFVGG